MNLPAQQIQTNPIQQIHPAVEREDVLDLSRSLGFLFDYRWVILGVAFAVTFLGAFYALVAQPIYEANILIQVDDSAAKSGNGAPKNIQSDLSTVFDIKTATASEMEVLRSRTVVSRAVDNTLMYITVQPKYFPWIGAWIARHNKGLSTPGLLGFGGYVWGSEQAGVSMFNVPESLEEKPFVLTSLGGDQYRVQYKDDVQFTGRVGEVAYAQTSVGEISMRVDRLNAEPGAQFNLVRYSRLETVEKVQKNLKISENRKDSGIIDVTLEGENPNETAAILNEIGREYVRQNVERKSEKAQKSLAFLDRQLPDLKARLEESENQFKEFRSRNRTFDLGAEGKVMLDQAVWVQSRMTELNQKRAQLSVRLQDQHPEVMEISEQMGTLTRRLATLENRIKQLPELEQEALRLNRDVKVNTELYMTLLATSQQLRLVTSSEVGNARLLDSAATPVKPIRPKRLIVILMATVGGLFLGVLAAFGKKNLFGRIDDPAEVEQILRMPVSGTIPYSENQEKLYGRNQDAGAKLPILQCDAPYDSAIESLRRLRTSIQFSMLESPNNVIMVTGPTPGVGKSFVAVNFSVVLASFGKKVLLIDGDLRAGNLHRYFGVERKNGISETITGNVPLEKVIHRDVVENVDFISTGDFTSKPSELLAHGNVGRLIAACRSHYDVVVIDTAPVLAVSDALVLASHAGSILNIVRGGVSTMSEIEEAVKQLNQAGHTVTGIVFNDMKARFARYDYGARYGKYQFVENKTS